MNMHIALCNAKKLTVVRNGLSRPLYWLYTYYIPVLHSRVYSGVRSHTMWIQNKLQVLSTTRYYLLPFTTTEYEHHRFANFALIHIVTLRSLCSCTTSRDYLYQTASCARQFNRDSRDSWPLPRGVVISITHKPPITMHHAVRRFLLHSWQNFDVWRVLLHGSSLVHQHTCHFLWPQQIVTPSHISSIQ